MFSHWIFLISRHGTCVLSFLCFGRPACLPVRGFPVRRHGPWSSSIPKTSKRSHRFGLQVYIYCPKVVKYCKTLTRIPGSTPKLRQLTTLKHTHIFWDPHQSNGPCTTYFRISMCVYPKPMDALRLCNLLNSACVRIPCNWKMD